MAKARSVFVCQSCGHVSSGWLGRCPSCGSYNTFVEERSVPEEGGGRSAGRSVASSPPPRAVRLKDLAASGPGLERILTGSAEFDRVLGGGLVPGELVLLGGEPGIGKSTLVMQTADRLSRDRKVCYVTGEESVEQVRLRAERLGLAHREFLLANETDLSRIQELLDAEGPEVLVVDSVQTMVHPDLSGAAGSVGQVREVTRFLTDYAKGRGMTVLVIGHVTKEGAIAGPKVLEHMVDCVLSFEGDPNTPYRLLRTTKNRYGATHEVGVFEMTEEGLRDVPDAAAAFLDPAAPEAPGTALTVLLEGTRPLVVEVQALTAWSAMAVPRRVAGGIETGRLALMTAVLDRMAGVRLRDQEVYVRVSGGLKVEEPGADLAVAAAIVSSHRGVATGRTIFLGEVGLNGFVRPVRSLERRLEEAARQGFRRVLTAPPSGRTVSVAGVEVVAVRHLRDLVERHITSEP